MAYFCYILECADGTYYTGFSTDPEKRLQAHNQGKGARYTKTRRPVHLVYVETQPDHGAALRREIAIKAMPRKRKEALIHGFLHGIPGGDLLPEETSSPDR